LSLTKEKSELLGSRLKEKNLLAPGTTFYWYRNREKDFQILLGNVKDPQFEENVGKTACPGM
jgi:hypothetical protein